jgi:hypothetical protein
MTRNARKGVKGTQEKPRKKHAGGSQSVCLACSNFHPLEVRKKEMKETQEKEYFIMLADHSHSSERQGVQDSEVTRKRGTGFSEN